MDSIFAIVICFEFLFWIYINYKLGSLCIIKRNNSCWIDDLDFVLELFSKTKFENKLFLFLTSNNFYFQMKYFICLMFIYETFSLARFLYPALKLQLKQWKSICYVLSKPKLSELVTEDLAFIYLTHLILQFLFSFSLFMTWKSITG